MKSVITGTVRKLRPAHLFGIKPGSALINHFMPMVSHFKNKITIGVAPGVKSTVYVTASTW